MEKINDIIESLFRELDVIAKRVKENQQRIMIQQATFKFQEGAWWVNSITRGEKTDDNTGSTQRN